MVNNSTNINNTNNHLSQQTTEYTEGHDMYMPLEIQVLALYMYMYRHKNVAWLNQLIESQCNLP